MQMTKVEQVKEIIKERISNSTYSPAQKLPSEYQLAEEFNVSRLTIRKAINNLISKKILVKDPGKGTYVVSRDTPKKIESGNGGLKSFTEVAKEHGKKVKSKILVLVKIDHPSDKIFKALALDTRIDKSVVYLERIRYWDNVPMTLEKIYICDEYLPNYPKIDFKQSLFKVLDQDVEISYSHENIEAILSDEEMDKIFSLDKKIYPFFKVTSTIYTPDAKPIFYDTSLYRGDKYSFKNTLVRYY